MKKLLFLGTLLSHAIALPVWADLTPDYMPPLCPEGSSRILPENFPASLVIAPPHLGRDFYTTLSATKNPYLIMSVIPSVNLPDRQGPFYWIKIPRDTVWTQDKFKATYSYETGKPVIRPSAQYLIDRNLDEYFTALQDGLRSYSSVITDGLPVIRPSEGADLPSSHFAGGNLLGLPGGLCLRSAHEGAREFAQQLCFDLDDHVAIDTSWLAVGHVDELVKVSHAPKKGTPCDFVITVPSPRNGKAILSLVSQFDDSNRSIIDVADVSSIQGRHLETSTGHFVRDAMMASAFKSDWLVSDYQYALDNQGAHLFYSGKITVAETLKMLNQKEIRNKKGMLVQAQHRFNFINDYAQARIDDAVEQIVHKINQRLPQCRFSKKDIIELPALYSATLEDGKIERARPLHPNPVNSLSTWEDVLFPRSHFAPFDDMIVMAYRARGITAHPIESLKLDLLDGNIHCATQGLYSCTPRSSVQPPGVRRDRSRTQ